MKQDLASITSWKELYERTALELAVFQAERNALLKQYQDCVNLLASCTDELERIARAFNIYVRSERIEALIPAKES